MQHDYVNQPPHYKQGDIECIDAIQAALTPEEFRGYLKGNVLKYTWRERHKGGTESIEKAQWYTDRLIKTDKGWLIKEKKPEAGCHTNERPQTLRQALGLDEVYDQIEREALGKEFK